MQKNKFLLLWLEGPMQSWGYDSKFNRRDTLSFPTKSALLGMVCSAMGLAGEQTDFLEKFSELDLEINGFGFSDTVQTSFLVDFHMVGSGYNYKDSWESLMIPKTSEGKKAVGGGSKLTYRYYIQDVAYSCVMEVPFDLSEQIASAFHEPIWDIYLGRKCCVPTEFIFQGLYDTKDEGLSEGMTLAHQKSRKRNFVVRQGEHEGEKLILNDVPISFGENKKYKDRIVTIIKNGI
jgi:CRISPR system Cascade subunit CasD